MVVGSCYNHQFFSWKKTMADKIMLLLSIVDF
jgi:hypothetical protein